MERVRRGMTARTTSISAERREGTPSRRFNWGRVTAALAPYLQVAPLTLTFAVFLLVPIVTIVVVSFWDYDSIRVIPDFILLNYEELVTSSVTWRIYLNTFKYAALTWALTLGIGFTVAYFVAFHVKSLTWQITLFMICTIPFWTSNIIRMISWIPFLGRNGILNSTLMAMGVIDQPLEFLLFSDFSVVLAFVHLYVLFMVVPIFNSMMRIDRALIEAAVDAGATGWQVLTNVIIPLSKPGIAIGSIFVVTLVMGDFITVRLMSGGQSASVGLMMANEISLLQYPAAAANAVVLLGVVLIMVALMLRIVDIRKEL
jgi:putative spermidine/putrescine transport system permease protein